MKSSGIAERCWTNARDARNEGLDCRFMALAAFPGLIQQGFRLDQHCTAFEAMLAPPVGELFRRVRIDLRLTHPRFTGVSG